MSPSVRCDVAANRSCPPLLLAKLALSAEQSVAAAAAANPVCPAETVAEAAANRRASARLRAAAAGNGSCPPDVLEQIAGERRCPVGVLAAVAANENCPPPLFAQFAEHTNDAVRLAVAANPASSAAVLERLSGDPVPEIRHTAAGGLPLTR